ncbi:LOW QUALITY PROTEIN: MAJIN isoform 3 [Pongo abelii]|uniref:MAJIN isoform 3 n=1 Tax=Pongo abelii TaxID=9601 RepID=A0A2J8TYY1_PONAB|nr:LOW QUALITY PROTEIN: MAJIN isoform 3 [Pongo abelii]
MSLKPFTYPFPETRFLHAGPSVYKFKIRYGKSIRGEEIENEEVITRELEVGKEAYEFWKSYSLHPHSGFNYFLQTESQPPLDNLASSCYISFAKELYVFPWEFKACILSQFS